MNFLSKNIKHLRQLKNLSQEAFADYLKVTRSRIGSYEENRSSPSVDFLIELSTFFNIPIDILIKNDLTKTKDISFIEVGNKKILFPIMVNEENENLIEVVPAKASAGYLLGYDDPEYIEQLQKVNLPFIPTGKHRMFPIKGDSMLPAKDGSYIIGEYMEDIKTIKSGYTYIVVTKNDGMTYKRVYNQVKEQENFLLKPDNNLYQPYEIAANEVVEMWKFTCAFNPFEYEKHELKISNIINLFQSLGIELKALEKMLREK